MGLNPRVAVYPGTFDPVHFGHLDMIRRGAHMFEKLIVAVGINPDKKPFFSAEERVNLLRDATRDLPGVEVQPFDGLVVKFVRQLGAMVMLRGLRSLSDVEYEFNMSLTNQNLDPEIETVFLMAQVEHSHFSSSLIRQIGTFGGDLSPFLPEPVRQAVRQRVAQRKIG